MTKQEQIERLEKDRLFLSNKVDKLEKELELAKQPSQDKKEEIDLALDNFELDIARSVRDLKRKFGIKV